MRHACILKMGGDHDACVHLFNERIAEEAYRIKDSCQRVVGIEYLLSERCRRVSRHGCRPTVHITKLGCILLTIFMRLVATRLAFHSRHHQLTTHVTVAQLEQNQKSQQRKSGLTDMLSAQQIARINKSSALRNQCCRCRMLLGYIAQVHNGSLCTTQTNRPEYC